jgi:hypothetical protein
MRRSSTITCSAWRKLHRNPWLHRRKRSSLAAMMVSMVAGLACASGLLTAFAASASAAEASAAEIGCVIALPDAPFVIPQMVTNIPQTPTNVTTQLYNNARQGANLNETILNPVNVHCHFGKLHQQHVKGQILAQPLYVHDVDINGIGRRNLVIVATAANIIYALDAEDLSIVFSRQLVPDVDVVPVPVCAETYPAYIGVTSTPVIDVTTGTVFVELFNPNPKAVKHELHALNLHDQFASDKEQDIILEGEPSDWPMHHRNRAGLLLSRGIVYVAFSSFACDNPRPYGGWVIGYSAHDLTQVARWVTPNSKDSKSGSSGIWQSGRGLVAADDGTIYFMTGNDSNLDLKNHIHAKDKFIDSRRANSFVKLRPSGPPDGLTEVDSFSPKNSSQLSVGDTDLGSSGPLLLPGDLLIGGGKQGRVYVVETSTMRSLQNHTGPGDDGFEGFQAFVNNYHPISNSGPGSCTASFDDGNPDKYCRDFHDEDILHNNKCVVTNACSMPISCYQYCQGYGPNIHAGFVYWQTDAASGMIYAMPEKESVKGFKYNLLEKRVEETPIAKSEFIVHDGMPGGALSISANGTQDGIVWVSMPNQADATFGIHRGSLVALDAKDLHKLWEDACIFYFAKFNPPTVADGHVYLATFADPVADADLNLAKKPGELTPDGRCDVPDPADPKDPNSPDLNLPVGIAWVIEYGLR